MTDRDPEWVRVIREPITQRNARDIARARLRKWLGTQGVAAGDVDPGRIRIDDVSRLEYTAPTGWVEVWIHRAELERLGITAGG